MNRSVGSALVFLGFALTSVAASVLAQTPDKPSLSGIVRDQEGGPIPGATVIVVAVSDGHTAATTTTNETGAWEVSALDPGTYRVSVSIPGFKTVRYDAVVVGGGQTVQLTTTLAIDPHLTIDEGNHHPSLTDNYSVGAGDLMNALPLFKRNAMYFVALLPGINTNPRHALQHATMFGLPASMTGLYLDGVSVKPPANGLVAVDSFATVIRPSPDLIEESSVGPSLPGGDASSRLPASIEFVTRTGTNRPEGSVYEYARPADQVLLNDFGVRSGGPVVVPHWFDGRGKVFYHVSYEEERLSAPDGRTAEHLFSGRFDANISSRLRASTSVAWQDDRWRVAEVDQSTAALVAQTTWRATLTANIVNEATAGVARAQTPGSVSGLTEASDTLSWLKGAHVLAAGVQSRVNQLGQAPQGAAGWIQDQWHVRFDLTVDAGVRQAAPHVILSWRPAPGWDWLRAILGDPDSATLLGGCARLNSPGGGHSCSVGFQRAVSLRSVIYARQLDVGTPGHGYRLTEVSYRGRWQRSDLSASYSHQSSREGADIPADVLKGFAFWQIAGGWNGSLVGRLEHGGFVDMSVRKRFGLGPLRDIECGIEVFDVTNNGTASITVDGPNANSVVFPDQTDQFDPHGRVVQFVVRVNW